MLGLTWDRVDLSRGIIRLELTKSGKRREVPMRQAVYDVLASLPEPRQGRVWGQRNVRTGFENAVAAARLDNLHFHDLRHHFASWFMMRGGSLQALKELLGHADLKMTLRYAHLAPEHLRNEMLKTERSSDFNTQINTERARGRVRSHQIADSSVVPGGGFPTRGCELIIRTLTPALPLRIGCRGAVQCHSVM